MNEEKPKNRRDPRRGADNRENREQEFEQQVVDIARVTRVTAGGKRMRFRACIVVGDKKGRVGAGVAKGADVSAAIEKAVTIAKKNLIKVIIWNSTIPHRVEEKYKAARVLLKPAPLGTGVIAGGPIRIVLEMSGVENVVSKMLGSNNKINNVRATINALQKLRVRKIKVKDEKEEINK